MLTQDQARQVILLASNYGNYEAAAEVAELRGYENSAEKMSAKSTETWLKLAELVNSLTEAEK